MIIVIAPQTSTAMNATIAALRRYEHMDVCYFLLEFQKKSFSHCESLNIIRSARQQTFDVALS